MCSRRLYLFLLFLLAALLLDAQSNVGGLRGTLTDSSGAVIPAAVVTVERNGSSRTAQSQADGSFAFSSVAAGAWRVSVRLPGFTSFEGPITIGPGVVAQLPIQLSPASGKQEVNVSAQVDEVSVEPDHNASATVVKDSDLDALPDDSDDLSDMLAQLAGPTADGNAPSIMLDGFTGGTLPPKSTIKEIRLSQNPFSAEYDDVGFGRVEIITKPGTESLHGSFQVADSDSYFNSRNPYAANKADYVARAFNETLSGSFAHKGSWTLNANEGNYINDAIIHAVTLSPSLSTLSVDQSVTTPRDHYAGTGRVDYQLTPNHTVSARYAYYRNDRDNLGIGGYSLVSRAYGSHDSEPLLSKLARSRRWAY